MEDSEIIVNVHLGKLIMLYDPLTVNKAIKFFRNTKSDQSSNIESLRLQL